MASTGNSKTPRSSGSSSSSKVHGVYCCVVGCHNRKRRDPVKFYPFPTKSAMHRKAWIEAVDRGEDWEPMKYTRICGAHFVGGVTSGHPGHPSYKPTIFGERAREATLDLGTGKKVAVTVKTEEDVQIPAEAIKTRTVAANGPDQVEKLKNVSGVQPRVYYQISGTSLNAEESGGKPAKIHKSRVKRVDQEPKAQAFMLQNSCASDGMDGASVMSCSLPVENSKLEYTAEEINIQVVGDPDKNTVEEFIAV